MNGIVLTYSFVGYSLQIGQFVYAPLRQGHRDKLCYAILLRICEKPDFDCRPIHALVANCFGLKTVQLDLIAKVASYYLTPISWCVKLLAPVFIWQIPKKKKLSDLFETVKHSKPFLHKATHGINLTSKQKDVIGFIENNLCETILLHGVTGSGKTEIYLSIAQKILNLGRTCLVLVPEISLTPQMARRFKEIFGDDLAVIHSGLSASLYAKEWLRIYFGQARIVLGVRSAIFCPLDNIGLIVVDEEHDQSYKASERPCYNARDVAVMRAKLEKACCVLGSATPSLESYWNATTQKYKYVELKTKYADSTNVKHLIFQGQKDQIAPEILQLINDNYKNNFQTLVLINRRGFVNYAICASCKTVLECPNCSVSTTIHNYGQREVCHYCEFNREIRKTCPVCQHNRFILKGIGTQNIEMILQKEIPNIKMGRLDRDQLVRRNNLAKILHDFSSGAINCLVGTQMLAKGHNFENVTLIVILNLEDGLFLPDFRSAEKTFHLLTQAVGRVGRGKYPGVVVFQSLIKTHPVIDYALQGNISLFLERELKNRQRANLPPYSRLILIEVKHTMKSKAEKFADLIKKTCMEYWKSQNYKSGDFFISGPYDAPIEKIKSVYRLHICIHMSKTYHPRQSVPEEIYTEQKFKGIVKIDVDPQNFV